MSMNVGEAFVTIRPDGSKFGKEAEKSVGSTLKNIGTKVGLALTAVGGVATKLSQDFIKSQKNLKQTIENLGGSWKNYQGDVDDAYKSQARFGNSSTEVNKALTALTLRLGDPKKALDNLQLTADIAALKNISLSEAAKLVGLAMAGSAKVLKGFGITTKDAGKAMDELRQKTRGMAEGEAKTLSGRLDAIKTSLQNFAAQRLGFVGPIVTGLGMIITAAANLGTALDSQTIKTVAAWTKQKIAAVQSAIAQRAAAATVGGALATTAATAGIAAVAAGGFILIQRTAKNAEKAGKEFASTFIKKIGGVKTSNLGTIAQQIDELRNKSESGSRSVSVFGKSIVLGFTTGALKAANSAKELKKQTLQYMIAARGGPPAIDPMTGAIDKQTTSYNQAKAAAERYKQQIDVTFGKQLNVEEASLRTKDALAALDESIKENGRNWDTNTAKGRLNTQARIDVDRAIDNEVGALLTASKTGKLTNQQYDAMKGRLEALKKKHPEVTQKVNDHLRAMAKVRPKRADITTSTVEARRQVKALQDKRNDLKSKVIKVVASVFGMGGIEKLGRLLSTIGNFLGSAAGKLVSRFLRIGKPHNGGIIMRDGSIKRYHSGGVIDALKRDEVPLIAQSGEGVLSRKAMKILGEKNLHALNRGKSLRGSSSPSGISVQLNQNFYGPTTPKEVRQATQILIDGELKRLLLTAQRKNHAGKVPA